LSMMATNSCYTNISSQRLNSQKFDNLNKSQIKFKEIFTCIPRVHSQKGVQQGRNNYDNVYILSFLKTILILFIIN
jgi:hypothetical protein